MKVLGSGVRMHVLLGLGLLGIIVEPSSPVVSIKWVHCGQALTVVSSPKERELLLSPPLPLSIFFVENGWGRVTTMYLQMPETLDPFSASCTRLGCPVHKVLDGEPHRHWRVCPSPTTNQLCDPGQEHQLWMPQCSHLWNGNTHPSLPREGHSPLQIAPSVPGTMAALGTTSEQNKEPALVGLILAEKTDSK